MHPQLKILIELQEADAALNLLEEGKRRIPEEIKSLDDAFTQRQRQLEAFRAESEGRQKERRQKERDLETVELDIKKHQSRLFEVKTNKEYQALQKEIENLQSKKSQLEDAILSLLDRIEADKLELKQKEQELKQNQEQYQQEKVEKEAELARIKAEADKWLGQRKDLAKNLEDGVLQNYQKILKLRKGLAVVPLKGGNCSGCFYTLRLQYLNEVKRNDDIRICEGCQRILYWKG